MTLMSRLKYTPFLSLSIDAKRTAISALRSRRQNRSLAEFATKKEMENKKLVKRSRKAGVRKPTKTAAEKALSKLTPAQKAALLAALK